MYLTVIPAVVDPDDNRERTAGPSFMRMAAATGLRLTNISDVQLKISAKVLGNDFMTAAQLRDQIRSHLFYSVRALSASRSCCCS